jgi:hypothetical protein
MVQLAASIAQAASTALPPRSKIIAPAVAASGLPVTAIQCLPCSGGFWVVTGNVLNDCPPAMMEKHNNPDSITTLFITDMIKSELEI